jgi:serine/threonine protein kinase
MEYCEHLDLGTYLREHNKVSEEHVKSIARQVLTGLSCMHEHGYAHGDVKPSVGHVVPATLALKS